MRMFDLSAMSPLCNTDGGRFCLTNRQLSTCTSVCMFVLTFVIYSPSFFYAWQHVWVFFLWLENWAFVDPRSDFSAPLHKDPSGGVLCINISRNGQRWMLHLEGSNERDGKRRKELQIIWGSPFWDLLISFFHCVPPLPPLLCLWPPGAICFRALIWRFTVAELPTLQT